MTFGSFFAPVLPIFSVLPAVLMLTFLWAGAQAHYRLATLISGTQRYQDPDQSLMRLHVSSLALMVTAPIVMALLSYCNEAFNVTLTMATPINALLLASLFTGLLVALFVFVGLMLYYLNKTLPLLIQYPGTIVWHAIMLGILLLISVCILFRQAIALSLGA